MGRVGFTPTCFKCGTEAHISKDCVTRIVPCTYSKCVSSSHNIAGHQAMLDTGRVVGSDKVVAGAAGKPVVPAPGGTKGANNTPPTYDQLIASAKKTRGKNLRKKQKQKKKATNTALAQQNALLTQQAAALGPNNPYLPYFPPTSGIPQFALPPPAANNVIPEPTPNSVKPNTQIISESGQTSWFNNHDVNNFQQFLSNSRRVVSTAKTYITVNNISQGGPKRIVNRQGDYDMKLQEQIRTRGPNLMALMTFLTCMITWKNLDTAIPVVNPRKK